MLTGDNTPVNTHPVLIIKYSYLVLSINFILQCVILSGLGYEVGGMGFDPNSESKSALFGSARCLEYFSGKREEFEIKLGGKYFQYFI